MVVKLVTAISVAIVALVLVVAPLPLRSTFFSLLSQVLALTQAQISRDNETSKINAGRQRLRN